MASATPATVEPVVRTTVADRVLEIVLDRPPANAIGAPIVDGLTDAVAQPDAEEVRAVLVRSEVPGFLAAGADIKQMRTLDGESFATPTSRLGLTEGEAAERIAAFVEKRRPVSLGMR